MKRSAIDKRFLLWGSALSGALLWMVWAWTSLESSRSAASSGQSQLAACQRLAIAIQQNRTLPKRASQEASSATDLTRRIEEASQRARLPTENLVRIEPQPAQRVGETSYKAQPTRIELREATLRQLVPFLLALSDEESGLQVTDLRLVEPRQTATLATFGETWNVEVTLTQLVFSPKTPPIRRPSAG